MFVVLRIIAFAVTRRRTTHQVQRDLPGSPASASCNRVFPGDDMDLLFFFFARHCLHLAAVPVRLLELCSPIRTLPKYSSSFEQASTQGPVKVHNKAVNVLSVLMLVRCTTAFVKSGAYVKHALCTRRKLWFND